MIFCRWILYDSETPEEMSQGARKTRCESFGFKRLGYFTIYRDGKVSVEITVPILPLGDLEAIVELVRGKQFEDATPEEYEELRKEYG
jgi:hypothetical protein